MLNGVVASKQKPCRDNGSKPLLTIAFCLLGMSMHPDAFGMGAAKEMTSPGDTQIQAQLARAVALLDGWSGNSDDLVQAKQALDDVLSKDPHSAAAYREYARYYMDDGELSGDDFKPGALEAAEKALAKALELSPR